MSTKHVSSDHDHGWEVWFPVLNGIQNWRFCWQKMLANILKTLYW